MDKLTSRLTQSILNFQKRFENLLEHDPREMPRTDSSTPFEASRDAALVRGLSEGLPKDHVDRAIVLFNRLSMHFDSGVLLQNFDGTWKTQAFFENGRSAPVGPGHSKTLVLPKCAPLQALKAPHPKLLNELGLSKLDATGDGTCLLLKPVNDFAYLLISHWPDLWLKDHTEKITAAMVSSFADGA